MSDPADDGATPDGARTRPKKAPNAFRTISEVADELHIPQHVLRFWETKFPQVKPLKRGGGRRYYRPDDIALLRRISDLLYIQGYTIKGVQRLLREGGGRLSDDIPPPSADEVEAAEAERAARRRSSRSCRCPNWPARRCSPRQGGGATRGRLRMRRPNACGPCWPISCGNWKRCAPCCPERRCGGGPPLVNRRPHGRSVAQSGSASVWGTGGRGFKSRRSDQ